MNKIKAFIIASFLVALGWIIYIKYFDEEMITIENY